MGTIAVERREKGSVGEVGLKPRSSGGGQPWSNWRGDGNLPRYQGWASTNAGEDGFGLEVQTTSNAQVL